MTSPQTPSDPDAVSALVKDLSQTVQTLFTAGSVEDTLTQVIDLAVATIEGCDFASVVLVQRGVVTSPAHTDTLVSEIDALQHATGEGPGVDAVTQGGVFYVDDLGTDPRWPRFGVEATSHGMRSLLALPLAVRDVVGVLNLYARYPQAFGVIDRARGVLLAALAALALTTAQSRQDEELQVANLHAAMASRELIGQAQGILIERERITPEQAFDILRQASQHLNVKLREIAQTLVDTGEAPNTGRPRPS